jgi:hypothetical protein
VLVGGKPFTAVAAVAMALIVVGAILGGLVIRSQ